MLTARQQTTQTVRRHVGLSQSRHAALPSAIYTGYGKLPYLFPRRREDEEELLPGASSTPSSGLELNPSRLKQQPISDASLVSSETAQHGQ